MSKRNRRISPAPRSIPSLREFWETLKRTQVEYGAPSSARAGSGPLTSSGRLTGSGLHGSGRLSGSGDGCGGYGIGLVLPDADARARIMTIMRELCERDAARHK